VKDKMQGKRVRFGDYLRRLRLGDSRELRQSDIAEVLGISMSFYSDIENNRRAPLNFDQIEVFSEYLGLVEEHKIRMYDLASYENGKIPADIDEILMYNPVGDLARVALRESKAGNADEEDWKKFIREIEEKKKKRERSDEK
jgi:transcriptional regulator with XRE-family HTH domain